MRKIFCPYCGEPLTNNCDCEFEVAMEEERMIEEIEERQQDSDFYAFQDFARLMSSTFNTMSYIDDPNEDADDNVIYCPDDGE